MITATTEDGGFTAQCKVFVRADMVKLNKLIAIVDADDTLTAEQYEQTLLDTLFAALDTAKAVASDALSKQAAVDNAYAALLDAYVALGKSVPLESVSITGGERSGDMVYVKVPWTQPYRKASVDLGIQVTEARRSQASPGRLPIGQWMIRRLRLRQMEAQQRLPRMAVASALAPCG